MFYKKDTICGLDIGSSFIRAIIAKGVKDGEVEVIGFVELPSAGIRNGMIVDINEASSVIKEIVKKIEEETDEDFNDVYISISGPHIAAKVTKGVAMVSKADGEISLEDVSRALENASAVSINQNRQILHVIPQEFVVDNERNILDPVGMYGLKLEVNALIIEVFTPFLRNLRKAVNLVGLNIAGIIASGLCSSLAVSSKRERELGLLVLDIGSGSSNLIIHEEDKVLHVNNIPLNAGHITKDLAIGLQKSIDIAERLKINCGDCLTDNVDKKETIDLSKIFENENGIIRRREIAEIIEARVRELFEAVAKDLKKVGRQKLLPAGVVLVGGGAKLNSLVDLAKEVLGMPARIGFPRSVNLSELNDPIYANLTGIIYWALETENIIANAGKESPFFNKIIKWFRTTFLP